MRKRSCFWYMLGFFLISSGSPAIALFISSNGTTVGLSIIKSKNLKTKKI